MRTIYLHLKINNIAVIKRKSIKNVGAFYLVSESKCFELVQNLFRIYLIERLVFNRKVLETVN